MLTYPKINPIAFHIGPLPVHWYGIMYLIGFAMAWLLGCYRARRSGGAWTSQQVADLIFYCALGVIIGGRLGYMLFYDTSNFLHNPLIIFKLWDGGMSYHGGLIGVVIALWWFGRCINKSLGELMDFAAPLVPIGLAAGRIGNFINGELWGRVTHVPWAMVFPRGGPLPRHPSQLYEFLLEGVLLFIIIWVFSSKKRPRFAVTALYLLCYGTFRFIVEFYRQPDQQLGFVAFGFLTQGQLLSIPMILIGLIALIVIYVKKGSRV